MTVATLKRRSQYFPEDWGKESFTAVVSDMTGGNSKVKRADYQAEGKIPIIDQGSEFISGYTDDESLVCQVPLPVILFGDHTRIFKFVTTPFVLGADGVKVIVPRKGLDPRFIYYALQRIHLPDDTGYSRHFKYLKESCIPVPPLCYQKHIAVILDKADAIRRKHDEALRLADDLLKSIFYEMFGDPVTNPKGWPIQSIGDIGSIQGGLQVTFKREANPLEIPYLRVANVFRDKLNLDEIKTMRVTENELRRVTLKEDDILIVEGHGNQEEIGRAAVWDASIQPCIHQNHLIRLRVDKITAEPKFISAYLNSSGGQRQLFRYSKTTSGLNTISTSNVRNTLAFLPPLCLQKHFVSHTEGLALLRNRLYEFSQHGEELFNSLVQRAFRGEL